MSDIGQLRRSGLVSTFGPGAIVDFRDGDAAISGVVAGLEEWDRSFPPPGTANPQSTTEPRLMQKLRQRGLQIAGFRLPPVLPHRDLDTVRIVWWRPSFLIGISVRAAIVSDTRLMG